MNHVFLYVQTQSQKYESNKYIKYPFKCNTIYFTSEYHNK